MSTNVKQPKRSRAKPLVADTSDSKCFADLRWRSGTAYATFNDGGSYTYDVSRKDFKEWANSGSLGGWFNEELR
jgi:hypothetical protein